MKTQFRAAGGQPRVMPLIATVKWLALLSAADANMSALERKKALDWLQQSRREFLGGIDGLSEEQWIWKPAPERWSVGETAEHIVLAEALLFSFVERAVNAPANLDWEEQTRGKTELLERVMAPRLGKAIAPSPIAPTGRLTHAQVKIQFEMQREKIVKFTRETQASLKEHTAVHPFPVFGTLSAYQWLIYVPLHTMRHYKQIAETKAAPGYPK
jgi:DinB superfamily